MGDKIVMEELRKLEEFAARQATSTPRKQPSLKTPAYEPPRNYGIVIGLQYAERYYEEARKSNPHPNVGGECAAGVQHVFATADKPLGHSSKWCPGIKVRGNNVKPGTAIASFRNGKYRQDHAAIFIRELENGLLVWDQFKTRRWNMRILKFDQSRRPYSNNGNFFYTIETSCVSKTHEDGGKDPGAVQVTSDAG